MGDTRKRPIMIGAEIYESVATGARKNNMTRCYLQTLLRRHLAGELVEYKGRLVRYVSAKEYADYRLKRANEKKRITAAPKTSALIPNLCTHRLGAYIN